MFLFPSNPTHSCPCATISCCSWYVRTHSCGRMLQVPEMGLKTSFQKKTYRLMFYPQCCGTWPNSGPTTQWGSQCWARSRSECLRCKRWWELLSLSSPTLRAHFRSRRTEIWVKFPYSQAKVLKVLDWGPPGEFWKQDGSYLQDDQLFQQWEGEFLVTYKNKQTFLVLLPLCLSVFVHWGWRKRGDITFK